MALSASTNFSVNRDQMITASLRVLSVIGQGRSATTSEVNDASQALNMVLKLLHGDGMPLWLVRNESITLTASTTSYTLGPSGDVVMDRPTFITHATLRKTSDTTDTDLNIIPQTDYLLLSDKTETGTPNSVYYDPQLTNGVMYVWPAADSTIAAGYTLELKYTKPIDDMDSADDDFEISQVWYEPIKLLLAVSMAPEYENVSMRKLQWLEQRAEYLKSLAAGCDSEMTSLRFTQE